MSLKFGALYKTPAMQAGLVARPLTFRQIFMSERDGNCLTVVIVLAPESSFLRTMGRAA